MSVTVKVVVIGEEDDVLDLSERLHFFSYRYKSFGESLFQYGSFIGLEDLGEFRFQFYFLNYSKLKPHVYPKLYQVYLNNSIILIVHENVLSNLNDYVNLNKPVMCNGQHELVDYLVNEGLHVDPPLRERVERVVSGLVKFCADYGFKVFYYEKQLDSGDVGDDEW